MKYFLLFLLSTTAIAGEWKSEDEAGVIISTGNSRTQSLSAKEKTTYEWSLNTLDSKASYLESKNEGKLSALRWDAGLRYERSLGDRWRIFLGQSVESDTFAGYRQRHASDLGARRWFVKIEKEWEWFSELGYRYQIENRTDNSHLHSNIVRIYSEVSHQWSATSSSKYWIEYLPNFSHSQDWLLNSELSSSFAITSIFALKLAYLVKYNNHPVNAKNTDSTYTTALVAKF